MSPTAVRDVGVGEVANELRERVELPARVRVGERDDLGRDVAHGAVLRRDLARPRAAEKAHATVVICEQADDVVGAVRRAVRRDDDVVALARILLREQVLDPLRDHRLLVVRGHHDAHGRLVVAFANGPRAQAGERRRRGRVADVRPRERAHGAPEERFPDHGRNRRFGDPRPAEAPAALRGRPSGQRDRAGRGLASHRPSAASLEMAFWPPSSLLPLPTPARRSRGT